MLGTLDRQYRNNKNYDCCISVCNINRSSYSTGTSSPTQFVCVGCFLPADQEGFHWVDCHTAFEKAAPSPAATIRYQPLCLYRFHL